MREVAQLNNNPVNRHAKKLLTLIDPESPYHLQSLKSVPPTVNRHPQLYLMRLMEWMLQENSEMWHPANHESLSRKLAELNEMHPLKAWEWLNAGKHLDLFQQEQNPLTAGWLAMNRLEMQLYDVHQEAEEVLASPMWSSEPKTPQTQE